MVRRVDGTGKTPPPPSNQGPSNKLTKLAKQTKQVRPMFTDPSLVEPKIRKFSQNPAGTKWKEPGNLFRAQGRAFRYFFSS